MVGDGGEKELLENGSTGDSIASGASQVNSEDVVLGAGGCGFLDGRGVRGGASEMVDSATGYDSYESELEELKLQFLRPKTSDEVGDDEDEDGAGSASGGARKSARHRARTARGKKVVSKKARAAAAAAARSSSYVAEIPFWELNHRKRVKLELARNDIKGDVARIKALS
mmetsp:Transcript_15587/g.41975  ORF Transcript_15587/g.41975 Transcript_15587/m.41975 type:complete len:170 (-) Transcript_15587:418-927(-)|eukprot:CAMPEP_0185830648 /NCGR_PEP_ID=MMETSP1353-20130828/996_1 /TAXON_ID=1077150 /ORGANISM="Erythrolobus australicus, Strain CCMP3124" /LENGTH=169 /DNA_ID=CAMNT_0028528609 /DNA_START=68 /DNA_END=577 /DNA_ORIENTATION=-